MNGYATAPTPARSATTPPMSETGCGPSRRHRPRQPPTLNGDNPPSLVGDVQRGYIALAARLIGAILAPASVAPGRVPSSSREDRPRYPICERLFRLGQDSDMRLGAVVGERAPPDAFGTRPTARCRAGNRRVASQSTSASVGSL